MAIKKQLWNSPYQNKKGIIFALDSAIAIIIVIIFLITASFYVNKEKSLPKLQINRIGSDILAMLDNNNILSTLNQNTIEQQLSLLLPQSYEMKIRLTGEFSNLQTNKTIPANKFVGSGKRIIIIIQQNTTYNGIAQYWVWLK